MANLFDTKEEIDIAIAGFKTLLSHPGWILVEKILDANIEIVKEQLELGTGENETKDSIERLRDKLRIYREVKNTPNIMIEKLELRENVLVDVDPYETLDQLKKRKSEAKV